MLPDSHNKVMIILSKKSQNDKMKQNIIKLSLLILFFASVTSGYANDPFASDGGGLFHVKWTPLQFGLFPPAQLTESNVNVYGLSFLMMLGQNYQKSIYGLDFAPGMSRASCKAYGVTVRLFGFLGEYHGLTSGFLNLACDNAGVIFGGVNSLGRNQGVSLAVVNFYDHGNDGVLVGIYNHSQCGWQFGLLNYNENSAVPWAPLFNYSSKTEMKAMIKGFAETVDVTLRISNDTIEYKEKIITHDNLVKIKNKILEGGKTQTYCNMFGNNPADETKSFWYYLNPDNGQVNINCEKGKSDFNHLTVRKKTMEKNQYIHFDFTDKNIIKISTSWPSDDLIVKDIRAFAENSIKEYLKLP